MQHGMHYLYLLWKCSTEHQSLPISGGRHVVSLHNTTDLRLKSHVKHTVCFIKYQESAISSQKLFSH